VRRFLKYIEGHETTYLLVWAALLVLTVITVSVSYYNFGILNIVVAMGVATIKGALVCLYFMHLKYDNKVNQVVFISAFVFLAVFVGVTASDVFFRPSVRSAVLSRHPEEPRSGDEGSHFTQGKDLSHSTPELIQRGQGLFKVHCMSCHASGKSFKSESAQKIHEAIVPGIPGEQMHSFSDLGEK